jgi:hypothetical protein
MLGLTYVAEIWNELTLTSMLGQIWLLPFLVYLNVVNTTKVDKWIVWAVMTLLLSYPNGKLQLKCFFVKLNTNKLQLIQFKLLGILETQMLLDQGLSLLHAITCLFKQAVSYLPTFIEPVCLSPWSDDFMTLTFFLDDAPRYKRGNKQLLAILCMNIGLYILTKIYYVSRNKSRDKKWNALTEEQRLHYLATTTDEGSKRLDFRFHH